MRKIWLIAICLTISGCEKAPETSVLAGLDFKVDKLFSVDGCSVYRFSDAGRPVYFTNCSGQAQYSRSCGKNCTESVSVTGKSGDNNER
ncbi:hypothetical protein J2067_004866 [Erwinia rhapontici]|nr:hypothetical protein [Erwinia rhapontici]